MDKSYIDFFFTTKVKLTRYSIHWERTHVDKSIYRLDNTPDKMWKKIKTFPIHFHNKKYNSVTHPPFALNQKLSLENVFRNFLYFVEGKLEDYIDELDAKKLEKEPKGKGIPLKKVIKKYSK